MHSSLLLGALAQLLPALLFYQITSSAHPLESSTSSPLEPRAWLFTFCSDVEWIESFYFQAPLVGMFPRLAANDKVYVKEDRTGIYDDELKRDLEETTLETGLSVRAPIPIFNVRSWEAKGE